MRPGSCRGVAAELGRGGGSSTLADRSPEVFWSSLARDRGRSPPGRGGAGAEGSAVGLYLACPRQRPRPPGMEGPPLQSPWRYQPQFEEGAERGGKARILALFFASAASAGVLFYLNE